jgi:hypothetical protein
MYSVLNGAGEKRMTLHAGQKQKATLVGSLLMTLKMIEIMEYSLDFVHLISVLIG